MTRLAAVGVARVRLWEVPLALALVVVALAAGGAEPRSLALVYLAAVTPYLCRVDLDERRLPNRAVVPGYAIVAASLVGQGHTTGWLDAQLGTSMVAGLAYFAFMLIPALAGGMGMGDVKLAGVLGLSAGLLGAATAVLSPLAAFLLGGIAAILALARGAGGGIPFGPFLLAGFWLAVALT